MLNKLMAVATVAAVAVMGLAAPGSAASPPQPSPAAERNAPMNWRHAGADQPIPSGTPVGVRAKTTAPPVLGLDMYSGTGNPTAAQWKRWFQTYKFVFIKVSEGSYYSNDQFSAQYTGATNVGMLRGGYHFASPHTSGGIAQADYFVNHGGGWTPDGRTLPGVLDIEYNPYRADNGRDSCYDLTKAQMVAWIRAFSNRYLARTGVYPTIYTTVDWWKTCTGNSAAFARTNPFWIAFPSSTIDAPPALPAGTQYWTYWQYGSSSQLQLDYNKFNGRMTQLKQIATTFAYKAGLHFAWANQFGHPISSERTIKAFGRTGYSQDFANARGLRTRAVVVGGKRYTVAAPLLQRFDQFGGITKYGWPAFPMRSATLAKQRGWIQGFAGRLMKSLVSSSHGTFSTQGPIRARWLSAPNRHGWPTADLVPAKTIAGAPAWQQRFRGLQGPSYATNPQRNRNVYWWAGIPK